VGSRGLSINGRCDWGGEFGEIRLLFGAINIVDWVVYTEMLF
jgi:hypothetical protein